MFVYSEKIIRFIQEIKTAIKTILIHEIGVRVLNERFFDWDGSCSYPYPVVIYNDRSILGYFDPKFYELGFHEKLMYVDKSLLFNIIRHELAHYMVFILHGSVAPHGEEFRRFCEKMRWGQDVYRATVCLEEESEALFKEDSDVLRKVKKLMALATSSNQNEAEQAMIKSQQLLLKYNIESGFFDHDEEKIYLKRLLKQKKRNAKMMAIAKILETFFVDVVYSYAEDFSYLKVAGNLTSVEVAEYVADVLQVKLEELWLQAKKMADLKGHMAKNSFFAGVAIGYCNKVQALKRSCVQEETKALMVIEAKLKKIKSMIYDRLSYATSKASYCAKSSAVGEQMGRKLQINPGVTTSSSSSAYISYDSCKK